MAFERFNKIGSVYKAKASISVNGVISFSEGARKQFELSKDFPFAAIFYDRESRLVGLYFLKEDDGSGVVNIRYRDTGFDFSAKSFLGYYNIQPKITSLYEVEKLNDGMIIIKLESARERKRGEKDKEIIINP